MKAKSGQETESTSAGGPGGCWLRVLLGGRRREGRRGCGQPGGEAERALREAALGPTACPAAGMVCGPGRQVRGSLVVEQSSGPGVSRTEQPWCSMGTSPSPGSPRLLGGNPTELGGRGSPHLRQASLTHEP